MVSKELFDEIPIGQIDFVQFLLKNGFLKLALSLTECLSQSQLKGIPTCPADVLKCMRGIVYLEGVGDGNEASKCFEQALEINPIYPQAARLASTYATNHNDAVRYRNLFIDSMKRIKNQKNNENFPRYGRTDEMVYKNYDNKESISSISEDMIAYYSFIYFEMEKQKSKVKQLAAGSLITEIIRSGNNNQTQVPEDMQREIVRDCIESGHVWANNIEAKQKEYGQFTCPQDNLVLQNTLAQATFYMDRYDPYDVIVINWKAVCLFTMKKYEECIQLCDLAIKIQPSGYFRHYLNKSMALASLGRKEEAESLLPIIVKESGDPSMRTFVEQEYIFKHLPTTINETDAYFYHYIEAAAYAAKEELDECLNNGRIAYLKDFVYSLNMGNKYSEDDILLLTTLYTPTLIYYYININAIYTNKKFLSLLLDIVDSVGKGYLSEMVSELCWIFALSYKDHDYFTPLRKKLIDHFDNETIALALQRMGLPLYNVLTIC